MDRDFESKKHRYSAASYLEVLEAQVKGWFRKLRRSYIFMQDNASIHTANKIKDWFRDNQITTTDWPLYSPDLNPIEHASWELKKRVITCSLRSQHVRVFQRMTASG
jgi:transposase